MQRLATHDTAWEPVESALKVALHAELDACFVPSSGGLRADAANLVVLDGVVDEGLRAQLLQLLCLGGAPTCNDLPNTWERRTCDDAARPQPTWGLKTSALQALPTATAVVEVNSRLQKLYPDCRIYHQPSELIQPSQVEVSDHPDGQQAASTEPDNASADQTHGGFPPHKRACSGAAASTSAVASEPAPQLSSVGADCHCFVANAAMHGDSYVWHVDADPSDFAPHTPWTREHGVYPNREPSKPRFVSMMVYLNAHWPLGDDAETLFLDAASDTGILVRPKPGRVVLMDQDVLHRVSAPSREAGRPRFSLVWKLVMESSAGGCPALLRRGWGRPCTFGSAHKLALLQDRL